MVIIFDDPPETEAQHSLGRFMMWFSGCFFSALVLYFNGYLRWWGISLLIVVVLAAAAQYLKDPKRNSDALRPRSQGR